MHESGDTVYKVEEKLPSAFTMFPDSEEWVFQQDNAPCHTVRSIKVSTENLRIKTLPWSAQSLELNLTKNP